MTTELEVYEPAAPPATLFGTDDPGEVVARATAAAKPLADVVDKQRLYATISGKKHVLVEGWCLLGSMLGVFPVTVWTRELENGFEARVEARTRTGEVVGAAEAQCDRSEKMWASRDAYALRSMAQTRATSKALRQPLGFVMTLAGFSATPAEEMPRDAQPIVDAEVIRDPDGNVFPDQREFQTGPFTPPPGATDRHDTDNPERDPDGPSDAQMRNMGRLFKKLIAADGSGQVTVDSLKAELQLAYGVDSRKSLTKKEASEVIASLKLRAGETD